jgi:Protein of unknown function (DUF2817)
MRHIGLRIAFLYEGILSESYFSETYETARQRFMDASRRAGAQLNSYSLNQNAETPLTIDVSILGAAAGPTLVVSSGLHGIEGFAGSAIQLAWLKQFLGSNEDKTPIRFVLIHAINPYGFAKLRRVNEANIDLNRNFLIPPEQYAGSTEGYRRLNRFLNPASPPSKFELFKLKMLWKILRYGLPKLKESVACGQYDYPDGLFYGGQQAGWSTHIAQKHCDEWLGSASRVVHIDVHTGLGAFGSYKLLVNEVLPNDDLAWYQATFGVDAVESMAKPDGTAYQASGIFGTWMQKHFPSREYRTVGAEFGTYDVVRILAALRAENRAHHYASPAGVAYQQAKGELLECFCPSSMHWRDKLIESGVKIIEQGVRGLSATL